ncbi:HAMP domain-containing sensor histidine kinase [Saxibacter everestensis]|uniref:histidine kinase n=1 Tax=Saxibacter everestensis TaxID=2909229 RepID=A0ABY8QZP5_9MICO|nr:HAMP domain-containing sensor histidine kinase [Brevibacteriaceae bacterium ZFBP1038]
MTAGFLQRPWPLRTRLAMTTALVMAIVIVCFTSVIYLFTSNEMKSQQDLSLRREATRVTRLVEAQADWTASGYCEIVGSPACSRVIGSKDQPETGGLDLPVTEAALKVATAERGSFYADTTVNGARVRMLITPLSGDRALLIGTPTTPVDRAIRRLGFFLVGFALTGVLIAGLSGYFSARHGLRPVRTLTEIAERVAATRSARHRIDIEGNDELARLAATMNTMLSELESAQNAQRQLVADASHELRTPLTSLRTNLSLLERAELTESMRSDIQASVRREMVGMTALVEDLIELARGEENIAADDVEMRELLRHCLDRAIGHWPGITYLLIDTDRTEAIEADSADRLWLVRGDAPRLARMINNLLDNAGKFSPPGATVTVTATAHGQDLEITVQDCGSGFDSSDVELVFERFYRSATARALPGSGLGLAIAKQTVLAHGGTIVAANTELGAAVTVRLPIATVADSDR